jgi:predicted ATPase/class 3 adenylate cyclase
MADRPTGTVTFLFTDIEGSTRLWEQQPEAMSAALARHDPLAAALIAQHRGTLLKSRGEGDSLFAVFASATDAVAAACALQQAFLSETWPAETPLRVRMALHTGEAEQRTGDYYGPAVNRCARLRAIAHGGQVLLSLATEELVLETLPTEARLLDLGLHRLRDLSQPERVFQLIHPNLPPDFPPLRSLAALPHNLPIQLTSFIGREKEIADVKRLLSATRLLTVAGAGGCGKTRLALQVAAGLAEEYADGVWLVELAALADPALVPQTVAAILGVREGPGRPLIETLADYLMPRKLLLVLDNCEHLLSACAQLAESLLRRCLGVRILATSREGLGIAGELTYRVPSLSLPELPPLAPAGEEFLAALRQSEAVRLFIDRAEFSQPGFAVAPRNAGPVAQLCHRLDGIPLAIELAAARVRALPVEQISARLDDCFRLLTGGSRTALPRQQTLRATIDWSYNLLSEEERRLLRRLSVFVGGWTLEAAEAVCSGAGIEPWEVLELLTRLVDQSVVLYEERSGAGGAEGTLWGPDPGRYRLLETVRQYAGERLQGAEDANAVRSRHQDFFLRLAEEAEPALRGPDQDAWLGLLETEHDNLQAALRWSHEEAGKGDAGLRVAVALSWFWFVRGYFSAGRRWLEEALAANPDAPAALRAKALQGEGTLAMVLGEYRRAAALLEESLQLSQTVSAPRERVWALGWLGVMALYAGENERANALFEEGLALCQELGDAWGITWMLMSMGAVAFAQRDLERATALLEENLVRSREVGDKWVLALTLHNAANVALARRDPERAAPFVDESLAVWRELRDRRGIARSLRNLALVALQRGDCGRAAALCRESLVLFRETGDKRGILVCFQRLAGIAWDQGRVDRAARLFGAADALRDAMGLRRPFTYEVESSPDDLAGLRAVLGEAGESEAGGPGRKVAAAWAEGRAMTLEQALEYALAERSASEAPLG